MKRIAFVVGLVVLVFAVGLPGQQKAPSAEQVLLQLEKQWADANVKADVAFLDKILADDWTWTDADGVVWTKAQSLMVMKSGEDVISLFVVEDMKARVYGDAAVVTGRSTSKEIFKGKDISGTYAWTDTWIKRAGQWRCVATHASKIPGK